MSKRAEAKNIESLNIRSNYFKKQCTHLKYIWSSDEEYSYGLLRIFRLILCISAFIFPISYVNMLGDKLGDIRRDMFIEAHVFFRIIFILLGIVYFDQSVVFLCLSIYFLFEIVFYLLSLIFLSDIFAYPRNIARLILLVMINYIEVNLCFAFFYKFAGVFSKPLTSTIEAIYFSVVVSSGIGFGDITPITNCGRIVVILHTVLSGLFVILILNYFISKSSK